MALMFNIPLKNVISDNVAYALLFHSLSNINYSRQIDRSPISVAMFPNRANLFDQNNFGIN